MRPLCLLLKSYKSHCKPFEYKHYLAVAIFAFWAIGLAVNIDLIKLQVQNLMRKIKHLLHY